MDRSLGANTKSGAIHITITGGGNSAKAVSVRATCLVKKLAVLGMVAVFVVSSFAFLQMNTSAHSDSNNHIAEIKTTSPTGTKFFNLTFIENHNFTSGIGNWSVTGGSWTCQGGEVYSSIGGTSYLKDSVNWIYDTILTVDMKQTPDPATPSSVATEFQVRQQAGINDYYLMLGSGKSTDASYKFAEIVKRIGSAAQSNWHYPSTYYATAWPQLTGVESFSESYNNTWERVIFSVVDHDLTATWHNLSESNGNAIRLSIQDSEAAGGVDVISSGAIQLKSYICNTSIRQILYDYPNFPISITEDQSISVHFRSNFTSPTYSGEVNKGTLENGYWNFTATHDDIGVWNQTFYMTNATHNVSKNVVLSIFPDLTSEGDWYSGNPVVTPTDTGYNQNFDPSVIVEENGALTMYFCVYQGSGVIRAYRYTSTDGFTWSGSILNDIPSPRDKLSVVRTDEGYFMVIGDFTRDGLYLYQSSDGVSWEYHSVILEPDLAWEEGAIQSPALVKDGDTWRLFYAAGRTPNDSIYEPRVYGMAYGADLTSLTKSPTPLSLTSYDTRGNFSYTLGSLKPNRLSSGAWLGVINGFSHGATHPSRMSVAMSNDLIHWYAYPEVAAFPIAEQPWENLMSYTGTWLEDGDGDIAFWFNGANGSNVEQIGIVSYGEFDVVLVPPEYSEAVYSMISLTVDMVGFGIVVAIVAGWVIPFSRAIKVGAYRTVEPMMKDLLKGVVFIIIALIVWVMLQNIADGITG